MEIANGVADFAAQKARTVKYHISVLG